MSEKDKYNQFIGSWLADLATKGVNTHEIKNADYRAETHLKTKKSIYLN